MGWKSFMLLRAILMKYSRIKSYIIYIIPLRARFLRLAKIHLGSFPRVTHDYLLFSQSLKIQDSWQTFKLLYLTWSRHVFSSWHSQVFIPLRVGRLIADLEQSNFLPCLLLKWVFGFHQGLDSFSFPDTSAELGLQPLAAFCRRNEQL